MRRRRLGLVACLAAFALGAAWWLSVDRLTAEERRLVGRWRQRGDAAGEWTLAVTFAADRRYEEEVLSASTSTPPPPVRWSVRDGGLELDTEPSRVRRLLRPLAPRLGLAVRPAFRWRAQASAAELVLTDGAGGRVVYTRAPAD